MALFEFSNVKLKSKEGLKLAMIMGARQHNRHKRKGQLPKTLSLYIYLRRGPPPFPNPCAPSLLRHSSIVNQNQCSYIAPPYHAWSSTYNSSIIPPRGLFTQQHGAARSLYQQSDIWPKVKEKISGSQCFASQLCYNSDIIYCN